MKSLSRTLKEAEKIIVENGRRRSENHRETQYVGALVGKYIIYKHTFIYFI